MRAVVLMAACAVACAPVGYGSESRPGALEDAATRVDVADVSRADRAATDAAISDRADVPDDIDVPPADDVVTPVDAVDDVVADDVGDDAAVSPQRSCASGVAGCGLVEVPSATITLGDAQAQSAAMLQPGQRVSAFAIDRYEVTVARFRRYWASSGRGVTGVAVDYPDHPRYVTLSAAAEPTRRSTMTACNWSPAAADRESHPINCVDWTTAMSFCVWDGGRLPTEAEWELAARGTDGRPWPWGRTDDASRSCDGRLATRATSCTVDDPAYAMGASPYGAVQMVGNVWEWCADWYGPFASGGTGCWQGVARTNPLCTVIVGDIRALRGGGWINSMTWLLRAASRAAQNPATPDTGLGFRCVRSR